MTKKDKNILTISVLMLFIIFWTIILSQFSPDEIIKNVGVENSYWIIFLIATFTGVSSFTSAPYYVGVATLAAGGANPILLAICAGIGMSIGDSLYYYLGKKGSKVLPEKIDKRIDKIENWTSKRSDYIKFLLIYIYSGFSPFPGDLLAIFLGITNFRFKFVIWPIILGNITFMMIIGFVVRLSFVG